MATARSHEDIAREKRRPKNPIKFKVNLNDEQKEAKRFILENPVTVLQGAAGSGKTLVAVQAGLDQVFKREADKIIITRPTVAKEDIGFLPGDIKEKMDPWLAPIYHNLYLLYDKVKIDKMVEDGEIEIVPFAFMRGRTFTDAVIVLDEAQNVTQNQMEMMIGRLGKGSRLVICGDQAQIDLHKKTDSGFGFLKTLEAQVEGVKIFTLKTNHRHEIVEPILKVYENYR